MNHHPFLASLSRRAVAHGLDFIMALLLCVLCDEIIPHLGGVIMWLLYYPVCESSCLMATPGKYLMGIQVIDENNLPMSFKIALIRSIMKIISTAVAFLGFVLALFTQKRQTLHDLVAHSQVIYGRYNDGFFEAWSEHLRLLLLHVLAKKP